MGSHVDSGSLLQKDAGGCWGKLAMSAVAGPLWRRWLGLIPFVEHPTGDFDSAVAAMEDAVKRLRNLRDWKLWITFNAQGEGHGPDSYEFAEVRMLGDKLDVGKKPLDFPNIIQAAYAGPNLLVADGGYYSVAAASPREVAHLLDAIFRHHFCVRSFADEGDDYAVVAEW